MAKSSTRKIEFRGQVIPGEYNDDDNIISVIIADEDGREYLVKSDEVGSQLIDFIDEYVEGTGVVKNVDGEYVLTVTDFESIDGDEFGNEDEMDWDDDEDDEYN